MVRQTVPRVPLTHATKEESKIERLFLYEYCIVCTQSNLDAMQSYFVLCHATSVCIVTTPFCVCKCCIMDGNEVITRAYRWKDTL